MRKVLAVISDLDRDKGTALSSLLATYKTLLVIDGYQINRTDVKEKIAKTQSELSAFWTCISEKYMFPIYLDKAMKINYENNTIYIDE